MQSTWNVHLFIYCTTAFKWWAFFLDNKNERRQSGAAFTHSTFFSDRLSPTLLMHRRTTSVCAEKKKDHSHNSSPRHEERKIMCSKESAGAENKLRTTK